MNETLNVLSVHSHLRFIRPEPRCTVHAGRYAQQFLLECNSCLANSSRNSLCLINLKCEWTLRTHQKAISFSHSLSISVNAAYTYGMCLNELPNAPINNSLYGKNDDIKIYAWPCMVSIFSLKCEKKTNWAKRPLAQIHFI